VRFLSWGYHFPSFFHWLLFYVGSVVLAATPCAVVGLVVSVVFGKRNSKAAKDDQ
jgi:integral membrane sensor domain MASE1